MDTEPPSWLISQLFSNFLPFWGLILLLLVIFWGAILSGYEAVLSHFNSEENENSHKHAALETLSKNPGKLRLTLLLIKTVSFVAIFLLSYSLLYLIWSTADPVLFGVVAVILSTGLVIIFGEMIPKIIAMQNPHRYMVTYRHLVLFSFWLFWPLSYTLHQISKKWQTQLEKPAIQLDVSQLSQVLDLNTASVTKEEEKILKGIVSFGNTEVRRVMKPRVEIFALKKSEPYATILPQIIEQGYSRIPVYEETLDQVVGVLYVKDLVPYINQPVFDWTELLRTPYFIAETKKLSDLLNDFKEKQVHLAIVTDEYGSTEGIVSLEDVIEEIVGEISDEYDHEDIPFTKIADQTYIFEGKTNLKDFYRIMQIEDHKVFEEAREEAETLAGFVLEISPEFPKIGDVINFKNYSFTVEAFENKRISRIRVTFI